MNQLENLPLNLCERLRNGLQLIHPVLGNDIGTESETRESIPSQRVLPAQGYASSESAESE